MFNNYFGNALNNICAKNFHDVNCPKLFDDSKQFELWNLYDCVVCVLDIGVNSNSVQLMDRINWQNLYDLFDYWYLSPNKINMKIVWGVTVMQMFKCVNCFMSSSLFDIDIAGWHF